MSILKEHKSVKESVMMPGGTFVYELTIGQADEPKVDFSEGRLTIQIPKAEAGEWMSSNLVGLEYVVKVQGAEDLSILIEKDFPCKDRDDEDKTDTFYELDDSDPAAC